jgi:predicted ATPase/DNA-binding CsgD family transcriptional regulator
VAPPGQSHDPDPATEPAHNLPVHLTRFVGRRREAIEVAEALAEDRLVTLTGSGGCGKTRLAVRVAEDVLDRYPDGVRLVDLAAVTDGDLVPQLVAQAVAVRELPGATVLEAIIAALRERRLLLVLDNCEHLVDASARTVDALLRACPGVRVLATSRQPLGLPGEVVWRVPPLEHADAVRLFLERARHRQPGFSLTPGTSRAVGEVCRGLDGLPLAIELATARVGVLAVKEIAGMLSDQLALLVGVDRTVEPRHRSLEAALRWSYDLLREPERALYERLALFSGWWGRDAAAAVGAGLTGDRPVLDVLGALVDQSLVTAETATGSARYRMLEPVRQFGLAQLAVRGAADEARRGHARYFADLAARAAPRLRGPEQLDWLHRLDDAEPDLRAAARSILDDGDGEGAADLGWSLWLFWWLRGRFAEGRRAMEQALGAPLPDRARARAAFVAGTMACGQADYGWAADRLDEAVGLFRWIGDRAAEAYALSSAGFAAVGLGRQERAVELLELGVEVALAADDRWAASFMSCFLGTIAHGAGEPERAARLGGRALELARAVGDREGTAMAVRLLAVLARESGDDAAAAGHFAEGLRLSAEVGDAPNIVFCVQGLAAIEADPEHAVRLWAAADALLERTDAGGYITRPDQEPVRRAVAGARAALGEDRFAAAWADGRALSPSDLLALALHRCAERPAPQADPDGLTPREAEVLDLIAAGRANKQIAGELSISVSTVEQHVTRLYAKIGARGRADAAVHALRRSTRRG